ncbi:MAG TPA: hypothetical protein VIZ66_02980 [Sphingomicrobium sp.]
MDRYTALLLLLALAVIPLFYASVWLGVPALIAIYALVARLAGRDLDRRQRNKVSLRRRRRKD